jgi:hypothetical protein
MAGSVVVSINFYSTEETGIHLMTHGTTKREELEAELACLSLFTCRNLTNLGQRSPAADLLANALASFDVDGLAAWAVTKGQENWLVPFRGPAKQRFEVNLNMDPIMFEVNIRGFGRLGRRLDLFAFVSVTSLIQYLCRVRGPEVYRAFVTTLSQIGISHQSGALRLTNQHDIAFAAWAMGLAELEDGTSTDRRPTDDVVPSRTRRRTEPLRARGRAKH